MAEYVREHVRQIVDVLRGLGFATQSTGDTIVFEDRGALTTAARKILAGASRAIEPDDITVHVPDFVVIESNPPKERARRLTETLAAVRPGAELVTIERFVDRLWRAPEVAEAVGESSRAEEDTSLPAPMVRKATDNPTERYETQALRFVDSGEVRQSLGAVTAWIANGEGALVVLAEAGLGKSELTRVAQWQTARLYQSDASHTGLGALRPVAVRIRLRELDALGLDSISDYMRLRLGLDQVRNSSLLESLLLGHRIVLLLDGLDEIPATQAVVAEGLRELNAAAQAGARIVLTSRIGFRADDLPLLQEMPNARTATLEPLNEEGAVKLLGNYGAHERAAKSVINQLPETLSGVPLFILWSYFSGSDVADASKPVNTLLHMIGDFCKRDESRIGMSGLDQMNHLSDIAYTNFYLEPVDAAQVGILIGNESSPFVLGPHALLRYDPKGTISFRYPTFNDLFLARAISGHWQGMATDIARLRVWLSERLGVRPLGSLTMEYVAALLDADDVRLAWKESSQAPLRYVPWLRRNLLGISLHMLPRPEGRHAARDRGGALANLIGSKDLSDTRWSGLRLESIAFDGWQLLRIDSSGAYASFCDFTGATVDESIAAAELDTTCVGIKHEPSEAELIEVGRAIMDQLVRPWRNPALGDSGLRPRIALDSYRTRSAELIQILLDLEYAYSDTTDRGIGLRLTESGRSTFSNYIRSGMTELDAFLREQLVAVARTGHE